ncbi:hypothetical protein BGW41_007541 [Actinomortierella wolfii]|nr:hypothetical protein BGW41_007541 [Actinomortierella wolfii]
MSLYFAQQPRPARSQRVLNATPFEPVQRYCKIFMYDVQHSLLLPTQYSTIGVDKLASFLEIDLMISANC